MGEKVEIIENESENIAPITHQRILWLMALITLAGSATGVFFASWTFGIGVFLGGLLALLNYYWLKYALSQVFDIAAAGEKPRIFGAQYVIRYLVFGLVIAVVYLTKILPIASVILGLSGFAFAVVVEGILRIFSSFGKKEI